MRFTWLLAIGVAGLLSAQMPVAASEVSCVSEIKRSAEESGIVVDQYYLGCLSQASYLIGDPTSKTAVVVDPERDVDVYIEDAKKRGLRITHVFLTHVHADFVAGHQELNRKTGAKICLSATSKASFPFVPFKDGDELALGKARLKVMATPGHTPEAISILVYDTSRDPDKPYAVLTGDCLFIGDVGRPDLLASEGVSAGELAGMMYDSLRNKLMKLPDSTLVYPAHGAGSLCGKNMSKDTFSTIGEQKKSNYALKDMTKEEFVKLITANQPEAPKYFKYDAMLNLKPHASLDSVLHRKLTAIGETEAIKMYNEGAQLLDTREADEYAAKYVRDTMNIPLSGRFAMWAGTFLDPSRPIVIIAKPGKERESAMRLGRIGFDNIAGFVKGGIESYDTHPDLIRKFKRETSSGLASKLKAEKPPLVLDVRTAAEREDSYIKGSKHVPLISLIEQEEHLPRDREIVIQCATGFRSAIAASILRQMGMTDVTDLQGGITAWKKANLPVEKGTAGCSTTAP